MKNGSVTMRSVARFMMIVVLIGLLVSCSSGGDQAGARSKSSGSVTTDAGTAQSGVTAQKNPQTSALESTQNQKAAPGFNRPDLDGHNVDFAEFSGKVVLVDFWATWCPPCRRSIPHLVDLHNKYSDQGLAIVGVSLDTKGPAEVAKFVNNFRIPYTVVMGSPDMARDWNLGNSIPTAFLVDREGKVVDRVVGYKDMSYYENLIKQYL